MLARLQPKARSAEYAMVIRMALLDWTAGRAISPETATTTAGAIEIKSKSTNPGRG